MNRKSEIKEYQAMLKNNEAEIARLTGVNKHIKTHIKFLQGLGVEEGEDVDAPQRSYVGTESVKVSFEDTQ